MFKNLIKLSNGRTTTKILATLLVITLTFANFALLGSFMIESIAIDSVLGEQSSNTNSQNVKFNAYLDLTDTSLREVSKDINSEELMLYVAVSVEGEGKLEKGTIDFSNSNFVLRDNKETYTKNIDTITSGNKMVLELPIVARKDSSFNLNLLNMISKIKLTGEYIDKNGNITNIDATKEVKIDWNAENITEEQVNVSQEVITNKICEVEGANKRVVQLLINTNIQDNKAPIKSTKIEIENPAKGVEPEKVKVTTYNTSATNGGDSIKFNNNQGSKWNYNAEENKTYIELANEADNGGNISWQKNAKDELIVTYIYDEQTVINSVSANVKVILELYGKQDKIEKQNNLVLETVEEKGNIVNVQSAITQNIYKGNMYLGQDTEYKTKYDILVSYAMGNNIYVYDSGDKTDSENLSTYYKSTLINKAQAINVLGEEGTIKICKADGTVLSEILLSEENSDEYFTVNYSEEVHNITIETSKPVNAGKIEIINAKAIKVLKLEKIEEATKLNVETKLYVKDSEKQDIENSTKQGTANLLEPKTSIDLELNKTSISNQVENELTITAVLNTNNNSNKLFDNPTINIELPKEITEATLLQAVSLLYEDELKIKSSEIKTSENGNKVISIALEGKQTKYHSSANIVMYLKVKANSFMANKEAEIRTTCINGNETVNALNKINVTSKDGLVTKTILSVDDNVKEYINKNDVSIKINTMEQQKEGNATVKIINNYTKAISDFIIVGTLNTNVKAVTLEGAEATILYAEDVNSKEWSTSIKNDSNIKAFKIEVKELEANKEIELKYKLDIPANVQYNEKVESNLNIKYILNEKEIQKEMNLNFEAAKQEVAVSSVDAHEIEESGILLEVKPKTQTTVLHENQVVEYSIKVTNISGEDLNNLALEFIKPNEATITELEYADAFDIGYKDSESTSKTWNIEQLKANDSIEKEVLLRINKVDRDDTIISSIVNVKDANGVGIVSYKIEQNVNKSKIGLVFSTLQHGNGLEILENEEITYILMVNNISEEDIENCIVQFSIPEGTTFVKDSEENSDCEYDEEKGILTKSIEKIEKGSDIILKYTVKINELDKASIQKQINNTALVELNNNDIYESNLVEAIGVGLNYNIELQSEPNKELQHGDDIKYIVKVKNNSNHKGMITITERIPSEISVLEISKYKENDNQKEVVSAEGKQSENGETIIDINTTINQNETLIIEIAGVVRNVNIEDKTKEISSVATVQYEDRIVAQSNEVKNVIKDKETIEDLYPDDEEEEEDLNYNLDNEHIDNEEETENGELDEENTGNEQKPGEQEKPQEPDTPEEPGKPQDPENSEGEDNSEDQDNKQKMYSISGLAWLDENKNGTRDNDEKILQGIEVILLDHQGNLLLNENGEKLSTITSIMGTYKFNNIKQGEYIVVFLYDTNKYAVSKYQVEDTIKEANSDVISKELTIENKTILAGVTDTIKIENSDIQNIDIGLVQNAKFDLSLEKYVSKVIVTNDQESTTYSFEETTLAKVEIAAKMLPKSSILVQYQIKISNQGDVDAYATDIVDYMPKELTFNSEMNPDWYSDSKGILHNVTLAEEPIKAGETKTVNLVLSKTLNSNSAGTIENIAEIEESANLEGIKEQDSIAGNKNTAEDDIGNASLIISIKTGGPILYIGIVILSLALLGTGIYLINKKVLKGGI